jgi:hypothetical protein
MSAAIAIPAIASAVGSIYGAHKQGQANSKALAFGREQAQNTAENTEADRHANYDQWAARQQRLNAITGAVGWGTQAIPGYTPGVMPHFVPRSVGDYVSGPSRVVARGPSAAAPNPYRVGDVNSYL